MKNKQQLLSNNQFNKEVKKNLANTKDGYSEKS